MKKKLWTISIPLLLLLAAGAESTEHDNAYVKDLRVSEDGVFILWTTTNRSGTFPACVDLQWHKDHWVFSAATTSMYREFYSMLLAAKTSKAPLKIVGKNACSVASHGSIESISSIMIK